MTDDVVRNRELWTRANAEYTDGVAMRQWSQEEITWGVWGVPESELRVLPDVAGLDSSSSGAGRRTCPHGLPGGARVWSAST